MQRSALCRSRRELLTSIYLQKLAPIQPRTDRFFFLIWTRSRFNLPIKYKYSTLALAQGSQTRTISWRCAKMRGWMTSRRSRSWQSRFSFLIAMNQQIQEVSILDECYFRRSPGSPQIRETAASTTFRFFRYVFSNSEWEVKTDYSFFQVRTSFLF